MAYPTAVPSATYQALEWIFGSPANVRVLRVLARHQGLLAAPAIADLARLSRPGAWKAIRDLERAGIARAEGSGRAILYQLDSGHPFSKPVIALFSAEQERLTKLFQQVRRAAESLHPRIIAIWVFGSVARGEDDPQSDVDIAVLIRTPRGRAAVEKFRVLLEAPSVKLRFRPSVISLTLDELRELPLNRPDFWASFADDAMVLFGNPPAAYMD